MPVVKKKEVTLHPVCALEKMQIAQMLREVAGHFSESVIVPLQAGCCGMAGDRGFLVPGLIRSATAHEAQEVIHNPRSDGYYSTTKTCEMALSEATGYGYESILFLVDECIG